MPSALYARFPEGVLEGSSDTSAQVEPVVGDFWVEVTSGSNGSCLLAKILILTSKRLGHHSLTLCCSVPILDNVLGRQPPSEQVEHSNHVLGDRHSRPAACVCTEALLSR